MILDKIENSSRYKLLEFLTEYKKKEMSFTFQKGKFEIDKDTFFGIGLEYDTKSESDCLWEAHKKYLDIHVILEGEEKINISETETMKPTMDFDYENDYQLFEGSKQQTVTLKKGSFLALFPNECHQTAIQVNESVGVKKIVFKILL